MRTSLRTKTFKREVAVVALTFWSFLTVRLFWHVDVDAIKALDTAYGVASTSIWLYAAAAFGMDSFAKQLQRKEPTGD